MIRTGESESFGTPHPAAPRLRAHVEMLAGDHRRAQCLVATTALQRAAQYNRGGVHTLRIRAAAADLRAGEAAGQQHRSISTAPRDPHEIVVLGAHYDTVSGCPGANDNGTRCRGGAGTGAAVRRHATGADDPLRRLRQRGAAVLPDRNMGSAFMPRAAGRAATTSSRCCRWRRWGITRTRKAARVIPQPIAADLSGRRELHRLRRQPRVGADADAGRRAFKARTPFPLQSAAAPASIPGVGWSDQWAFWQAGYPGMMVTDTAPFRYPWYHTAEDTPDKIDFDRLAHVIDGLEAVIQSIAAVR